MKKILACALAAFALLSCGKQEKRVTYSNPLDVAYGDPFVLHASDGRFYMYGTSGDQGFKAYSSDDLVHWTDEGLVYQGATPESWTLDCFWAPEVYERDGKYYLFFSANWKAAIPSSMPTYISMTTTARCTCIIPAAATSTRCRAR